MLLAVRIKKKLYHTEAGVGRQVAGRLYEKQLYMKHLKDLSLLDRASS